MCYSTNEYKVFIESEKEEDLHNKKTWSGDGGAMIFNKTRPNHQQW